MRVTSLQHDHFVSTATRQRIHDMTGQAGGPTMAEREKFCEGRQDALGRPLRNVTKYWPWQVVLDACDLWGIAPVLTPEGNRAVMAAGNQLSYGGKQGGKTQILTGANPNPNPAPGAAPAQPIIATAKPYAPGSAPAGKTTSAGTQAPPPPPPAPAAPPAPKVFPVDMAIKVIRLAQNAHASQSIAYEAAMRSLLMWEQAYEELTEAGFAYEDAVVGSYDLTIRSKTEKGSPDRKFAEESFGTVFPFKATACKVPAGAPVDWHPSAALALPLVRAGLPVWLTGSKGVGKTHALQQLAAALGRPCYVVQGTRDTSLEDFVGVMTAEGGSTKVAKGPLRLAMEEGGLLIVEEPSVIDPAVLMTLQQVLTGQPLTVTGLGEVEVVYPRIDWEAGRVFSIAAADNTVGLGEGVGYVATQRMNDAFLDRWYFVEFGHLSDAMYKSIAKIQRESRGKARAARGIDAANWQALGTPAQRAAAAVRQAMGANHGA